MSRFRCAMKIHHVKEFDFGFTNRFYFIGTIALIVISILSMGCGNTPTEGLDINTSTSDPSSTNSPNTSENNRFVPSKIKVSDLSGKIKIDGSSTVFPITEAVAEEFGYLTSGNVRVVVGVSGSGGGFKKF